MLIFKYKYNKKGLVVYSVLKGEIAKYQYKYNKNGHKASSRRIYKAKFLNSNIISTTGMIYYPTTRFRIGVYKARAINNDTQ